MLEGCVSGDGVVDFLFGIKLCSLFVRNGGWKINKLFDYNSHSLVVGKAKPQCTFIWFQINSQGNLYLVRAK